MNDWLRRFTLILTSLFLVATAAADPATRPAGPVDLKFYKARDYNDWVDHSLHVQTRYARVLLVTRQPDPPKSLRIAPLDLNAPPGQAPDDTSAVEYPIAQVFPDLQDAADASRGGDLIAVAPGKYAGFIVDGPRPGAEDGSYIHFKAMGKPGEVVINDVAPGKLRAWMIFLTRTHHIIIDGFDLDGTPFANQPLATRPASRPASSGSRPASRPQLDRPVFGTGRQDDTAGIMLGSGFDHNGGVLTHHIIVINNFSHHHAKWGMHTTDTYTCLVQNNLFAFSRGEHGCYVSDGSDDYVIRRNIFMSNNGCGLQCNLDADTALRITSRNPALADFPKMSRPYDDWGRDLVKLATAKFGENGFPDGRGINYIIEQNVATRNGKGGGAAFNLSGVQDSLIQNNLAYDNIAHGITVFNQGGTFEGDQIDHPFTSPAQITGPGVLPIYGSHTNIIRNNTVLMDQQGRAGILALGGSYGCTLRNNIVINSADDAIHVDTFSIWHFDSGYNVLNKTGYSLNVPSGYWVKGKRAYPALMPPEFKTLATHLDEDNHSIIGVTRQQLSADFVRDSNEPWVIFEGDTWRLNPDRPDFHLKAGSKLLDSGDRSNLPALDLAGTPRKTPAIGALGQAP